MFSTNIGCPIVRDTPSASNRAMTSVEAPAPVGTISLMGRLGQLSARAKLMPITTQHNTARTMIFNIDCFT